MAKLNYAKASKQWQAVADNYRVRFSLKARKAKRRAWNKKHPKAAKVRQYFAADKQDRTSERYWSWRRAVLKRDKYRCQDCNAAPDKLHAHHIKPWYEYPAFRFNIQNGKTLCPDCHIRIHPWLNPQRFKELQAAALIKKPIRKVVIRRPKPPVI